MNEDLKEESESGWYFCCNLSNWERNPISNSDPTKVSSSSYCGYVPAEYIQMVDYQSILVRREEEGEEEQQPHDSSSPSFESTQSFLNSNPFQQLPNGDAYDYCDSKEITFLTHNTQKEPESPNSNRTNTIDPIANFSAPFAMIIHNVLNKEECTKIIQETESIGYSGKFHIGTWNR